MKINVKFFKMLTSFLFFSRDFYSILNVPRRASKNQIKKAYRLLAQKLHPDKNKDDPRASDKFSDINDAYSILSNEEKRELYDQCGEECVKKESGGMGGGDPFASFFGDFGFFGTGGQQESRDTPKGATITMDLYVTLDELYLGNFVEVICYFITFSYYCRRL